jgi:hypothetical protein
MSEKEQEWFVAERTRALAMIHLTRRQDLVVRPGRDVGLEFLVSISRQEGEPSLRQFGIFLRGTRSAVTEDRLNGQLRPTMASFRGLGQFPFPVCLWHFTMDDDQGYHTWVAEPAVVDGRPRLLRHTEAHCRKLDRATLDELVAQVDRWYDAFFASVSIQAS